MQVYARLIDENRIVLRGDVNLQIGGLLLAAVGSQVTGPTFDALGLQWVCALIGIALILVGGLTSHTLTVGTEHLSVEHSLAHGTQTETYRTQDIESAWLEDTHHETVRRGRSIIIKEYVVYVAYEGRRHILLGDVSYKHGLAIMNGPLKRFRRQAS